MTRIKAVKPPAPGRWNLRARPPPPCPPPSCPGLFRASTWVGRLARARPAPRCRKTWMPGTSPGMTRMGERRGGGCRPRPSLRPLPQSSAAPRRLPPSCPDLFRASTWGRRLGPSRPAPRRRKTWMPGTSPGMTKWGARRRVPAPPVAPAPGARARARGLPDDGRARPSLPHRHAPTVMPGLVPGIHVGRPPRLSLFTARRRAPWMPGTSPGMTTMGQPHGNVS